MNRTRRAVHDALESVRVIDAHCHVRPEKPAADTLADIVLYHHVWVELVSSGMGQYEVTETGLPHELGYPGMPPLERVRQALPYLGNLRSTTAGVLLRWLLQDLYGISDLSERNLDDVFALVQEKAGDSRWQEAVLRGHCGIETSITVEPGGQRYAPSLRRGREMAPTNLAHGKQTPSQILAGMAQALGHEIGQAEDVRLMLVTFVRDLPPDAYAFIALWPPACLTPELARDDYITQIIRKAHSGQPLDQAELGSFSYFSIACLLDELRRAGPRVIQCMVGAEVLPPHRAICQWSDRFTGAIGRLANQYEDFRFNLMSASDLYTQDLAILAKHIPNVSVAGYWWHTLYPFYIKKSLEIRLDTVPMNKIIAYFSDAYHCEWCYPKLKLVKQILEDILVERIERGWYTLPVARDIVQKLFYDNPKAIYEV